MQFRPLSKTAEDRLLTAVDDVVQHVQDGLDPTAAVVKSAMSHALPPGHIKHLAYAYNASRSEQQRHSADPAASFPLADPAAALTELYPDTVKTAAALVRETEVDGDYQRPPLWLRERRRYERLTQQPEKQAAAPVDRRDSESMTYQAFAQARDLRRELEEARRQQTASYDQLHAHMDKLASYFEGVYCEPFHEVRRNVELLYGRTGAAIMNHLAARGQCFRKHASLHPLPVDDRREPYATLVAALKAADACLAAQAAYTKIAAELPVRLEGLFAGFTWPAEPDVPGPVLSRQRTTAEKLAAFGAGSAFFNMALARELAGKMPTAKTEDQLLGKATQEVNNPQHEGELRNIRTTSVLNDLMANDEVISGHPPEQVMRAASELMQVAPHIADQSAIMRALLRKQLSAGALDPYDMDSLVKMEGGLKTRDTRPKDMGVLQGMGAGAGGVV